MSTNKIKELLQSIIDSGESTSLKIKEFDEQATLIEEELRKCSYGFIFNYTPPNKSNFVSISWGPYQGRKNGDKKEMFLLVSAKRSHKRPFIEAPDKVKLMTGPFLNDFVEAYSQRLKEHVAQLNSFYL